MCLAVLAAVHHQFVFGFGGFLFIVRVYFIAYIMKENSSHFVLFYNLIISILMSLQSKKMAAGFDCKKIQNQINLQNKRAYRKQSTHRPKRRGQQAFAASPGLIANQHKDTSKTSHAIPEAKVVSPSTPVQSAG